MSKFMRIICLAALLAGTLATWIDHGIAAQTAPPAAESVTPDRWPRSSQTGDVTYTIYQPQVDSWDGYQLKAHAAVSVQPAGAREPAFGVLGFAAKTRVDRVGRTVYLHDFSIETLQLPTVGADVSRYRLGFLSMAPVTGKPFSLDRLEALLAISGAEKQARQVTVRNDPPRIVFASKSTILVPISGQPVWRPLAGTDLERVLNTRPFLVRNPATGDYFLHLFDGYMTARSLDGPWRLAGTVPPQVNAAAKQLAKAQVVDLLEGETEAATGKMPTLQKYVPDIMVATTPTELIITQGEPVWAAVNGTRLAYLENTTANVFRSQDNQMVYVLVSGRWFRATGLAGPWQHVGAKSLPADFARIGDDSPKENIKASLPGTSQAQEAVVAAQIPQTATVYRDKVKFTPLVDGEPQLQPITGTSLRFVRNSPHPLIMVAENQWYAVQDGIWFTAQSLNGPWTVADSLPASIYGIPPDSPLHFVTYVKVYEATADYVVVGYTAGYLGTNVGDEGVVVYGTGYDYPDYVSDTAWYPAPVTYGYAAGVTWTPWTGWIYGFGFGWPRAVPYYCVPAPYWGAMPYAPHRPVMYRPSSGGAVWGPSGWTASSGNVYQRYGSTAVVSRTSAGYNAWNGNAWSNKVGTSYNSTTGSISAGQKASVANVYTGDYAYGKRGTTVNPNTGATATAGTVTRGNANAGTQKTVRAAKATGPAGKSATVVQAGESYYAGSDGVVYKNTGSGWQRYDNGSWSNIKTPAVPQNVQSQPTAKSAGDSRSAGASWGSDKWGSGFDRSPERPRERSEGRRDWEGGSFGDGGKVERPDIGHPEKVERPDIGYPDKIERPDIGHPEKVRRPRR